MDRDHYFLRGVRPVTTSSSILVSSSKYLNNPRLRDWVAMISLRQNGQDLPAAAELVELFDILHDLRDYERIESLFHEERKTNQKLSAWFEEEYYAPEMKIEDYANFAADTLGGALYKALNGVYEVEVDKSQWKRADSQYEYYWRRHAQTHDLEHILTGGTLDALGELVPAWFKMTNVPRFIKNQELACELVAIHVFASLRYTVRTMLHYPEVWMDCADAIQRGIVIGSASDPLFLAKLEPVLSLPICEAREILGVRGVVDRDTSAASAFWEGARETPPVPLAAAVPFHVTESSHADA